MLFHIVLSVCFVAILAAKIEINAQFKSRTEKPEAIFADVIKNISRVNNELQDLINNYEQYKKTQSFQDNYDSKPKEKHLTESQGSRINRNYKNSIDIEKKALVTTSSTLTHQTEIIYAEDDTVKSSEAQNSREVELQQSKEEDKSYEEQFEKLVEKIDKKKNKYQKTTTKASNANKERPKEEMLAPIKTKYSEKETLTKYLETNSSQLSLGSDLSVESEQLFKEEVKLNKPKERASEKYNEGTPFAITAGIYLRSEINGSKTTMKSINISSLEFINNDEDLNKDIFKTSVLRQAYGEACLKLVIRKCYKACKAAFTSSCRVTKCKKELKEYFDKTTRTECIKAFNAYSKEETPKKEMSHKEDEASYCRMDRTKTKKDCTTITREGYLSMACQTPIEQPTRRHLTNNTRIQKFEEVNILRDRYEKACQRISQNKCKKACHNAQNVTCAEYECQKRFKKNLKRNCKRQCKVMYSNKSKYHSESSDSDDTEDTDDSDDTDDTDDSDDSEDDSE